MYTRRRVAVYLDRAIADDGEDSFPSNQLIYALIQLSGLGGDVRPVDVGSGHIIRAGWIAFGDVFSAIDELETTYWREPVFLNFNRVLWTPNPSTSGGGPLTLIATRVKWHLGVGTVGHLYVFGA